MTRRGLAGIAAGLMLVLTACGAPSEELRKLDAELSRTGVTGSPAQQTEGPAIRIVGSSTVAPFAETVAEQFGAASPFKTPIIETTGTGGGFKAFCSDRVASRIFVVNASRPIKPSERALCAANGFQVLLEFAIGYDGIAIVNAWGGPDFALTKTELFRALAAELPDGEGGWVANPNRLWSDIVPGLPAERIRVSGPPPTSGTRDAFLELAMEPGALGLPQLQALKASDPEAFRRKAHTLRNDGAWLDAGENDAAIIQSLVKNEMALGVLGFSFLNQNADRVRAASIGGVTPTYDTISNGEYAVSRSLYFYIRPQDISSVPGLADFVMAFTSEDAIGPDGYLIERGLIPLSDAERQRVRETAAALREQRF